MKNTNQIPLFLLTFILACLSCNKTNDPIPETNSNNTGYYPMAVGNYWIYDNIWYNGETQSVDSVFSCIDTIRIIRTQEIDGNTFFVFEEDTWSLSPFITSKIHRYLRDSSGYLVDHHGYRLFTSEDLNTQLFTVEQTNGDHTSFSVPDTTYFIATNAGDFECLSLQGDFWSNGVLQPKKARTYYAEDVGMVMKNAFGTYNDPYEVRRVLREYHLEE